MLASAWANPNLAPCPRPKDMSVSKAVVNYSACLAKKRDYCERNQKLKECQSFLASQKSVDFSNKGNLPSERCAIQRDGSYKCVQNPLRFVLKDSPNVSAPATSATPEPSASSEEAPASPTPAESPK